MVEQEIGMEGQLNRSSGVQVKSIMELKGIAAAGVHVRDDERRWHWAKRLVRFLAVAIQAEAERDYFRAGRAFVLALLCEGRLQGDFDNPWQHVYKCVPIY